MTNPKEVTPPPTAAAAAPGVKALAHTAPSQPNSPLAKRPKTEAMAVPETSETVPAVAAVAAVAPTCQLQVKKLVPEARAPTRGSAFAAGYDLYAAKETVIPGRGKGLVSTGLAIAVPEGTCKWLSGRKPVYISFQAS